MAELLGSRLVDTSGRAVSRVHDVRLVFDGPVHELTGRAALRVAGLVVGRGSVGNRLGYGDREVVGPALLRLIFGALSRRARFVPWERVTEVGDGRVTIDCAYDDLGRTGRAGERAT